MTTDPNQTNDIDDAIVRAGAVSFLGGPREPRLFLEGGRNQLIVLLSRGLRPDSKVLDVGCGALRAGFWLVRLLNRDCYFGIEPAADVMQAGIDHFLDEQLIELKRPRFDTNPDFDFSVFNEEFDYVLARSIWTHATKDQIITMLDGFVKHTAGRGTFLTSYLPKARGREDYLGDEWVGFSHESNVGGWVHHSLGWIRARCRERGLYLEEIADPALNFRTQQWLGIHKVEPKIERPPTAWDRLLKKIKKRLP